MKPRALVQVFLVLLILSRTGCAKPKATGPALDPTEQTGDAKKSSNVDRSPLSPQTIVGSDLSGIWQGTLYQDPGGTQPQFAFQMLIRQNFQAINGTSWINEIQQPRYYGVMPFQGTVKGNLLEFTETGVVEQNARSGTFWLIKSGKLTLTSKGSDVTLSGPWSGLGGSPGHLVVRRVPSSSLVFDRGKGTIELLGVSGNSMGVWEARNNLVKGASPFPTGNFSFSHYNSHKDVANPNSAYGSYGILVFNVEERTGLGVHSGRANATFNPGPPHPTEGCIRTTDSAMRQIVAQHVRAPIGSISVK